MGNEVNIKVEKAKIDENVDLEKKFIEAAKHLEIEQCNNIRKLFIKRLAKEIIDCETGISPKFLKFCEDLNREKIEEKDRVDKLSNSTIAININKKEFLRKKTTLNEIGDLNNDSSGEEKSQFKNINKECDEENINKKKEDQSLKTTNRYFGFHMNNVRAISTVGSSAVKNSGITSLLAQTAKIASSLSLVGITLTYLTTSIFDDESTKMKKHTLKMVNRLRKEIDLKLYYQCFDDLRAELSSISKIFNKLIEMENTKDSSINQVVTHMLQSCDVIFQKIVQKKILFQNSNLFIEFFYFFVKIHLELVKFATNKLDMYFYDKDLTSYIREYQNTFKDYLNNSKKIRAESFNKITHSSSWNIIYQIFINQYKIYENIMDEFTSEVIIRTEKTYRYNEMMSGNVYANICNLYHEMDKFREKFFEIDIILNDLRNECLLILNQKFDCIEKSFDLYLKQVANID